MSWREGELFVTSPGNLRKASSCDKIDVESTLDDEAIFNCLVWLIVTGGGSGCLFRIIFYLSLGILVWFQPPTVTTLSLKRTYE
jgi:hypothetical protein